MIWTVLLCWYSIGWAVLAAFVLWGQEDALKLCDVALLIAGGPVMLSCIPLILVFFVASFYLDKGLAWHCGRLPRFSCRD